MSNERLTELLARKLSGDASAEELKELELLVQSNKEAAERMPLLQKFWEQHDSVNPAHVEESLQKVLASLELPSASSVVHLQQPKKRSRAWLRIAASFILVALVSVFVINRKPVQPAVTATAKGVVEKYNSKGIKSTIELSDGSKIWLNADSKIEYPKVFTGTAREVHLHGEAFFEVAKNPAKPFIIHLDKGTIRVLGTSFNVRAYDNESLVETSVRTGKVAFIPRYKSKNKKADTVFITPDNKVSFSYKDEQVLLLPTVSKDDQAWTDGTLIFKDNSFEEIAEELERSFGKEVIFVSEKVKSYRFRGSFNNDSLDKIMFYLSRIKDFKYKITGTQLIIGDSISELP
jgi:transmembrane sensor